MCILPSCSVIAQVVWLMHGPCAYVQVKEEGWWLVLGDAQTNELHAVKRTSFGARASARLAFEGSPDVADVPPPGLTLFLVSWHPWPPDTKPLSDPA